MAGSFLIAGVIDVLSRRRDYAVALVNKRTAELQDSLASLELARQEAAAARDQAMEGSRLKSQFLANMSHAIRTPLNGVIGMTGLLIDSKLDPEQRDFAETARRSGEALLDVINDVLDFSKIEARKLELETSEFDLAAVVQDVAEILAPLAHREDLEITTSTEPDLPSAVAGDPGRVRQVLTNLLSNAIKFTDSGEVAISVCVERTSDPPRVRFSVRDTGVGIDEAAQERLFEPFTQADASTTRRYGGTGLGLAISKRLTEIMGGSLGMQSRPGAGSTFWFEIPFIAVPEARRQPVDPEALAGLRVLIIDDNATNRAILERQVSVWGTEPVSAPDGPSGLRSMGEAVEGGKPYDVVLLDWNMPGMDGFDVAQAICEDQTLTSAKPVLLTSVGISNLADSRIPASLTKPVRPSQLFNTIAAVMGIEARRPYYEPTTSAERAWRPPAGLRVLVAEDNQVNQRVVAAMLGRLGFRVDVVGDGQEAVAAFSQLPYDVVLMDCQMPQLNGYEATKAIRRREANQSHVPIVALTASAMKGDQERCLAAGMDAYIAKPVRMCALAAVLRCSLVPPSRQPLEGPLTSEPESAAIDVDEEALEQIRALGLLSSITTEFRRAAPNDIGKIKLGLLEQDRDKVSEAAHRLKGSCLILGATRMAAVAAGIEDQATDGHLALAGELVPLLEQAFDDLVSALEASIARA